MVEYYVRDVGAAGSNPVTSTSKKACIFANVEVQAFLQILYDQERMFSIRLGRTH